MSIQIKLTCDARDCPNEARYVEPLTCEILCGLHASPDGVRPMDDEDLESAFAAFRRHALESAEVQLAVLRENVADIVAAERDP